MTLEKTGRRLGAALVTAALLCVAGSAHATTDIAALDGRFLGMAGTGIASSSGAVSMFHNPALIGAGAGKADLLVSSALAFTHSSAPVAGPYQQQSDNALSPAGFIAATYKVLPRLALGLAFQPTGGSGGKYELNGAELSAGAFALEADAAAAYQVTDRLSLGVMYRVGFLASTSKSPDASAPGATVEASLKAADFFAFTAGAAYRFGDENHATKVGVYYRSRLSAQLTGDTKTANGTFDTTSHYATPEKVQLGVSQDLLGGRLLLGLQGGIILYGALPGSTTTTLQTPGGAVSIVTTSNDMSVWEAKAGGEFWVLPQRFAVRAGVWLGPEEVREERVSLYNSFVGFYVKPTLGAGVQLGRAGLDLGAALGLPHGKTVDATSNGNAGEYSSSFLSLAFTFNYRFD